MSMLPKKDSAARQWSANTAHDASLEPTPKSAPQRRRGETRLAAISVTNEDTDPYADPPCTD